ncbi:hypothetical protein GGS20DRAFT_328648 [Poronia punctata]|nr:hypothetical protein GGS20DRAFT_328648 [Poronia punctata]
MTGVFPHLSWKTEKALKWSFYTQTRRRRISTFIPTLTIKICVPVSDSLLQLCTEMGALYISEAVPAEAKQLLALCPRSLRHIRAILKQTYETAARDPSGIYPCQTQGCFQDPHARRDSSSLERRRFWADAPCAGVLVCNWYQGLGLMTLPRNSVIDREDRGHPLGTTGAQPSDLHTSTSEQQPKVKPRCADRANPREQGARPTRSKLQSRGIVVP